MFSAAIALGFALITISISRPSAADEVKTGGTCNVTLVRSAARDINLSCNTDDEAIKRLRSSVNQLVKSSKMTDAQIDRLLKSLNDVLGLKSLIVHQSTQLDHITEMLEGAQPGAKPDVVVGNVEKIVKDTLARNVQRVGPFLITLKQVQASYGQVSIYFDIVNDGVTDARAMWFGGGSFGNGGSSIIVRGQRILASSVEVGGMSSPHFADPTFIPGVHMEGRVDFHGVAAGADDIEVFELGYSQRTLRPQVMARFVISG